MKKFVMAAGVVILSCAVMKASAQNDSTRNNSPNGNYSKNFQDSAFVDLTTGQTVNVRYDKAKKMSYNAETNRPINFYVNTATGDTIYGAGRYIINNYIMKNDSGTWQLDKSKVRSDVNGLYSTSDNKLLQVYSPPMSANKPNK
ncbi:MAG: hypothetical protein C5B52_14530 [Bacteroidetes bacterium]|nr:MAG: hypothetical protein C5B52_14530 [Bacteroidota bacterium]